MATITDQQPIEVAPRREAPLGGWGAVPGTSGPPKREKAFLARLAGRVVEFLTEAGFPALGPRHPGSVSTREKAELEMERARTSAYFLGPF